MCKNVTGLLGNIIVDHPFLIHVRLYCSGNTGLSALSLDIGLPAAQRLDLMVSNCSSLTGEERGLRIGMTCMASPI